jgi:hypothetical protein
MVNSAEMRTAFTKSKYSDNHSNQQNPDTDGWPAQEPDNSSYYSHHTVPQHRQQLQLIYNTELIS